MPWYTIELDTYHGLTDRGPQVIHGCPRFCALPPPKGAHSEEVVEQEAYGAASDMMPTGGVGGVESKAPMQHLWALSTVTAICSTQHAAHFPSIVLE